MRSLFPLILVLAAAAPPATAPMPPEGKLPHIRIDREHRQVLVECEAINPDAPLELLLCQAGTKEYEALLRTRARPSHLHLALLMIGLEPGRPVKFGEGKAIVTPPRGPSLRITCRFERNGREVTVPAHQMMRSRKTHDAAPALAWIFTGGPTTEDGEYAADVHGHLISVVNFEHTPIDVAQFRSDRNESLDLEFNPDVVPPRPSTVWLVIEADKPREPAR